MVSTVTVSTITTIAATSLSVGIGIFATLLLIGFLTGKEVLGAGSGERRKLGAGSGDRRKLLARSLSIGVVPLLIGFAVIVGFKVAEILA